MAMTQHGKGHRLRRRAGNIVPKGTTQGKRTTGTGPKNERFNTQTDLLPPKAGKASQLLKMLPT